MQSRFLIQAGVLAALSLMPALARSAGPDPRKTGAPGDEPLACTQCHAGTLNAFSGSVRILLEDAPVYKPGVKQRIKVQVSDPDQRRWGFQLTARLNSDPAKAQAGDLVPVDDNTKVICENGAAKPCPDSAPVQFVEHTSAGTRLGTTGGVTFEFDWTPPTTNQGAVTLYVAGNAANGNGSPSGDHIYTSQLTLSAADEGPQPVSAVPVTKYRLSPLASDIAGLTANTDPNLVNPWGLALGPTTAFWVSNNHAGNTTVYNGNGEPIPAAAPLVVKIPLAGGVSSPTGQVYNSSPAFELRSGAPAGFIFATEQGTIAGWNRTVDAADAVTKVDNSASGAVYKGLAIASLNGVIRLYAANFSAGKVDVFDGAWQPAKTAGRFADPALPAGFAPFNVAHIGGSLLVAYAKQNDSKSDDVAGAGNGYVNVFDLEGNFVKRLISGGGLNSPWGITLAPPFFGDYSNTLLVGNFGDGAINAYDPLSGAWLGALLDPTGNAMLIDGLWALQVGNGKSGGDANTLYFTAGLPFGGRLEDHGLFGSIQVAPAN